MRRPDKIDFATWGLTTLLAANIATLDDPIREEVPLVCDRIDVSNSVASGERVSPFELAEDFFDEMVCNPASPLNPAIVKSPRAWQGAVASWLCLLAIYGVMGWDDKKKRKI